MRLIQGWALLDKGDSSLRKLKMLAREVEEVVHQEEGGEARLEGWGSQWSERIDVMGGREEQGGQASWSEVEELWAGAKWLDWTEEIMGLKGKFVGWVIGKSSRRMTALKERGGLVALCQTVH